MDTFNALIMAIIGGILALLVVREFFCWYLKINKRLEIQKMMLETLLKIYEKEGGEVNWEEVKKAL